MHFFHLEFFGKVACVFPKKKIKTIKKVIAKKMKPLSFWSKFRENVPLIHDFLLQDQQGLCSVLQPLHGHLCLKPHQKNSLNCQLSKF